LSVTGEGCRGYPQHPQCDNALYVDEHWISIALNKEQCANGTASDPTAQLIVFGSTSGTKKLKKK